MYFSICIPQYDRTDFLLKSLESMSAQDFRDFEVCISDGGSKDGGSGRIEEYLRSSGLRFVLRRSERNLRYDENLRTAISLSRGRYLLLNGNDDALARPDTLSELKDLIEAHQPVGVAISNYHELSSGREYRRMRQTGSLGGGPDVAAATFRHYAFVGGVVLDGDQARANPTDACDGSEMYQMYLGARIVAGGGRFLAIDRVTIHKDIQLPDQSVESYRTRPRIDPCPVEERPLPLGRILETVGLGIEHARPEMSNSRAHFRVGLQLYVFTYPFWIIEYRRVQSFNYSLGVYLALRPNRTCRKVRIKRNHYLALWVVYVMVGACGFVTPIRLFDRFKPWLYRIAKEAGWRRNPAERGRAP